MTVPEGQTEASACGGSGSPSGQHRLVDAKWTAVTHVVCGIAVPAGRWKRVAWQCLVPPARFELASGEPSPPPDSLEDKTLRGGPT